MTNPTKPRVIKGKPHTPKSIGTWAEFETRYEPLNKPDCSLLHDWDEIPLDIDVAQIWTVLDCDGKLFLCAGIQIVNRFAYIICKNHRGDGQHRDYRY